MPTTTGKKRYTQMREEDFSQIKMLQSAGLSSKQVQTITGRSQATVDRSFISKDLEGYKALVRATYTLAKKATGEISEKSTSAPAKDPMERMADAMERLADAWETSPKRRLF